MAENKNPEAVYYLDSNVLIDLIEHKADTEPAKPLASILNDAANGRFRVVTSVLTIAEVYKVKRELDGTTLDPQVEDNIQKLWHPSSPIELVEVHQLGSV